MSNRLKKEGNETVTNCNQLKLRAEDGKMRLTDVADQEQLFRLIQSIPSPKAEPFKVWMAKNARLELERKTGRKVVSPLNASDTGALEVDLGDAPPLALALALTRRGGMWYYTWQFTRRFQAQINDALSW